MLRIGNEMFGKEKKNRSTVETIRPVKKGGIDLLGFPERKAQENLQNWSNLAAFLPFDRKV